MRNLTLASLILALATLQSCAIIDHDRELAACGGGNHRLRVADLDMSPDPIAQGQRINRWIVRLRADGSGECRTTIRIRETGGDVVARESVFRLRPGINTINMEPSERYRLSRGESCFQVEANIAGTSRPIDAERRFCAHRGSDRRWTMR